VLRVLILILLAGLIAAAPAAADVTASVETAPLFEDVDGADADDPAIWVNPFLPGRSVVVATKKDAGLTVFDLQGRTLQDIPSAPGRFNNADLVYDARVGSVRGDLVVVSDRGRDHLRIYRVDPLAATLGRAPLRDVTTGRPPLVFSADEAEVEIQATAYGVAAFTDRHGSVYALASRRSRTAVALLRLKPAPAGPISYEEVDRITLPDTFTLPDGTSWAPCQDPGDLPQVEGMVVDPARGVAFLGQEVIGIWKVGVGPHGFSGRPVLIDRSREFGVPGVFDPEEDECVLDEDADPGFGGEHVSADVEGLTIYRGGRGRGYLLASSQGDDTFAVYADRGLGPYVGSFAVADGPNADGVQESDGAAVVNVPLGPAFPRGLLVTQDGDNAGAGEAELDSTNFKLTRWDAVAAAFRPPLLVDPFGFSPRD
jgi:3-phytase